MDFVLFTQKFKKNQIVPTEEDTYFRYQTIQGYVHDMGAAMQAAMWMREAGKPVVLDGSKTNRRVSVEDILSQHNAGNIIQQSFSCKPQLPLEKVIAQFATHPEVDSVAVLGEDQQFVGEISMSDLRPVLIERVFFLGLASRALSRRRSAAGIQSRPRGQTSSGT